MRLCALAAGKAFPCRAMARWIAEESLSPDVTSAVRVTPGVDAHVHWTAAGVADRQFGFSLTSGAVADAVRRAIASECIRLRLPVPRSWRAQPAPWSAETTSDPLVRDIGL